ncbi:hypothetical protein [Escherichia coli]|uniref:hypothetical protein n=1 Tax=Escherichia coli TaxID=562 RepID=UPI0010C3C758|nr:putative phage protein [Escherichia coli]
MINRTKLEHILEYARQQRRFGQLCKILPGDMVEIVDIAMRKTGNSPVTPDGWISRFEEMPDPSSEKRVCAFTPTNHEDMRYRFVPASLFKTVCRDATHWFYMLPPVGREEVAGG